MKTHYSLTNHPRIVVAGILFLAAAALAAIAVVRVKLPWAAVISKVGAVPFGVAVDTGTNTIYITNSGDNTISVIDGSQCDATNSSHCAPVATMINVGFGPSWPMLDSSSATLYVTNSLTETGEDGNTVAVLDIANCNAQDTSGCSQAPAALVIVGSQADAVASLDLDPFVHTLYVGDATDGPISMINTDTCNAHQTSGCNQVVIAGATGAFPEIDQSNHSVYVVGQVTPSLNVFNGATCNATTQSDCGAVSVAPLPSDKFPYFSAIDPSMHTLYLVLFAQDALSSTAIIDENGYDESLATIKGRFCYIQLKKRF